MKAKFNNHKINGNKINTLRWAGWNTSPGFASASPRCRCSLLTFGPKDCLCFFGSDGIELVLLRPLIWALVPALELLSFLVLFGWSLSFLFRKIGNSWQNGGVRLIRLHFFLHFLIIWLVFFIFTHFLQSFLQVFLTFFKRLANQLSIFELFLSSWIYL